MQKKAFISCPSIKGFTILEILLVVVIMGILATLGVPAYQNFVETCKSKTCQVHIELLKGALDMYSLDHDTMPASLSWIPQEYIEKAYARILQQRGAWKIKLAYFILNCEQRGLAYAAFLRDDLAKGDIRLITCPKDSTPPEQGGISYGMNSILANRSSQAYRNFSPDTLLIGDCNNAIFSNEDELDTRHKKYIILGTENYAQAISKDGTVKKIEEETMEPTIIPDDCPEKCNADMKECKKACEQAPDFDQCIKKCNDDMQECNKECSEKYKYK